jgi:PAS domain S-box-containing protein
VESHDSQRSATWRYGLATLAVAIAAVLTWLAQFIGLRHPTTAFLAAILLTGWTAGPGPAFVATALSILAYEVSPLTPPPDVELVARGPRLIWFVLFAVLATKFSIARQRATRLLRDARDGLERQVGARTAELQQTNEALRREIAERRRTEAELRDRTLQLDQLFDQAPEAIALLDGEDIVVRINRQFTALFGYTADEAVGQSIYGLVVPDDLRTDARRIRARALRRSERVELETVRQRKDGSQVPVLLVGTAVNFAGQQLAQYLIYRDITEPKQLENQLRRSQAYLAEAERLTQTGSWAVDVATGEIVYWSAELYRICGLDPSRGIPTREAALQLYHPEDRPKAREQIENAIHERRDHELPHRIIRPDGTTRHLHSLIHPVVNSAGAVIEIIGTTVDVTERRRAERALRRARERGLRANFTAVLEERTRLAREIHDTLLQGFTGVALRLVAAINRVAGPPEATAALRDVVELARMTLEDARRAVWDLRSPALEGGDLTATLRSVAEDCIRGTELTLAFESTGPPRPVDPAAIAVAVRVVQEAITNAVKHAAAHTVQVHLAFEARGLRLAVSDDGRGFVVDPDLRAYGGHWGLLGMRERASQVRGRLRIRSSPGQGTEVVFLAPYLSSGASRATRAGSALA